MIKHPSLNSQLEKIDSDGKRSGERGGGSERERQMVIVIVLFDSTKVSYSSFMINVGEI